MNRRQVLKGIVGSAGLIITAAIVLPSLVSAFSPVIRRRRQDGWQPLGRAEEFPVGAVSEAVIAPEPEGTWPPPYPLQGVYVWRPEADQFVVFSRACTDLGCPVNFDPGSKCYFCPCHGGIFNTDGEPMAGPPPRPLHRYAARVRNGILEIDPASVPPML